jgi:ABC-type antimicrobial peptide transport system permease subunit
MNLKLLSVTDRRHEIGLRRALGGRRRDILLRFLFESLALTSAGGLAGLLLGIIAAIVLGKVTPNATAISWVPLALAVGGAGIPAVMLMSVRERVKEIGLRRALGTKSGDILFQFLVEAVQLSLSGGIVGVIVGIIVTFVVAHLAGWEAILSPQTIPWAVASSVGIGLLFGTIPARKASLASPVQSLRAE